MTDSPRFSSGRPGPHRRGEANEPGPTEWSIPTSGVGPWEGPLPDDPRYDPELLRDGDSRNVVDAYRYWTREAIVADIDKGLVSGGSSRPEATCTAGVERWTFAS